MRDPANRPALKQAYRGALAGLGLALAGLLAGCGGLPIGPRPAASPPPANGQAGTLGAVFPSLATMPDEARTLRIEDDWMGLSPVAPLESRYSLERQGNGYEGKGVFSAGRSFGPARQTVRDVIVPLDLVQGSLRMLLEMPVEEGRYTPKITRTDDYPSVALEVDTAGGPLRVYTRSQDDNNVPWAADYVGRTFVVNSDIPARAYVRMKPYLKPETLKALIDEIQDTRITPLPVPGAPRASPAPSPSPSP